jgi:hypothetical protein
VNQKGSKLGDDASSSLSRGLPKAVVMQYNRLGYLSDLDSESHASHLTKDVRIKEHSRCANMPKQRDVVRVTHIAICCRASCPLEKFSEL